jgi:KaiC/GvpD/RAD55 family RecA-like ATPase
MFDMTLIQEQEGILDSIMANPECFYVLTGTPGSGKIFFIKFITQYLQLKAKIVLLSRTMGLAS